MSATVVRMFSRRNCVRALQKKPIGSFLRLVFVAFGHQPTAIRSSFCNDCCLSSTLDRGRILRAAFLTASKWPNVSSVRSRHGPKMPNDDTRDDARASLLQPSALANHYIYMRSENDLPTVVEPFANSPLIYSEPALNGSLLDEFRHDTSVPQIYVNDSGISSLEETDGKRKR
uniref:Uncharacterized protein n=1 Tax=Plectus sambesii TaxID=2011161 RepID=A0A914UWX1_9BILA